MPTIEKERSIVRDLARRVLDIANEDRMVPIIQRWKDVNALRKPDRAPVWCRPVGCWPELLPEESLECEDSWLRGLERGFRRVLIKRDIDDDDPIENYFTVGARFDVEPANVFGVDVHYTSSNVEGGAWAYDPPLRTESDFDRLQMPRFTYNAEKTRESLNRMTDLLGDIAPVFLTGGPSLGATLGGSAANLRGLEQIMVDMIDDPGLLHRLMAHLRDATLTSMDVVENAEMLTPNNVGPMTASDPIGQGPTDGNFTFQNCWCSANSQEFDAVSPARWEEFCLDYQRPIFERCGMVAYGCCENLTTKIDAVLSIPNLRVFVCSAWTDLNVVLDRIGTDYCIMWRQKASAVVYNDESKVKDDLMEGMQRLQGRYYQVVLRELQTLAGNPDRLHVWTRMGKDAAEKYA
jgi:hypothetical protein